MVVAEEDNAPLLDEEERRALRTISSKADVEAGVDVIAADSGTESGDGT